MAKKGRILVRKEEPKPAKAVRPSKYTRDMTAEFVDYANSVLEEFGTDVEEIIRLSLVMVVDRKSDYRFDTVNEILLYRGQRHVEETRMVAPDGDDAVLGGEFRLERRSIDVYTEGK